MADLFDVVVARKLSGGGGGGSSDFSTAEVTVVNSSLFPIEPKRAVLSCCEANQLGEGLPAMVYPSVPTVGNGVTAKITVPLYKGSCAWTSQPFGDTYSYTLAGDIDGSMGMYLITGDCTITVRESI